MHWMDARHERHGAMASAGEHAGTEACSKQIIMGGRLFIPWKKKLYRLG